MWFSLVTEPSPYGDKVISGMKVSIVRQSSGRFAYSDIYENGRKVASSVVRLGK